MTTSLPPRGRGAGFNPPNRFEELHMEPIEDDPYFDADAMDRKIPTAFYRDASKTILAKNSSPDVGFTYSLNPYRGCEHGCVYCYARPTHEYLGFSSGIDFETKIMVKMDAAMLLAETLQNKTWKPQVVALSGNTDCYQPAERRLEITRSCLKVFLEFRNPVAIVTKNALVRRDIDLLKEMAKLNLVCVTVSLTTLDRTLARTMEPRTSTPQMRLETIEALAGSGIPVGVNIAPIIPGLNDEEIPSLLREAARRGARFAGNVILRLPYSVKDLFLDWVKRTLPERAPKIINRIRETRGGKLNATDFGKRMSGEGEVAAAIHQLFESSRRRFLPANGGVRLTSEHFQSRRGQLKMF